jgi:hypothetical protein
MHAQFGLFSGSRPEGTGLLSGCWVLVWQRGEGYLGTKVEEVVVVVVVVVGSLKRLLGTGMAKGRGVPRNKSGRGGGCGRRSCRVS